MRKILVLTISFIFILSFQFAYGQIKIAVVGELMSTQELEKVEGLLRTFKNTTYSIITAKDLNKLNRTKFTHLWIHKTFVNEPTAAEINCKTSILEFINKGGNVFLSREAVLLLNNWGIEKQIFEVQSDTIRDEGFGRPLGFHAFKSHPLFAGLHGGVYPNKALNDHVVRKIGFFGNNLPLNGKVAGIEWTYITFHENSKLLLEYQIGKGKIIAAGSFIDYSIPNFNTAQLNLFTQNVFRFTSGQLNDIKKYHWQYEPQLVKEEQVKTKAQALVDAGKWEIPMLSLQLQRNVATQNFTNLAGRRILIMGKEKGGIDEIWVHPFMAMRDYQVEVIMKNGVISRLNNLTPKITISPEMLIREYEIGETKIKEIITHSLDKPMAVMHYEWSGNLIKNIIIQQTSNLRYMWPYSEKATQNIRHAWIPEINAMLVSGQSGELSTLTSFSSIPTIQLIAQGDSISYQNEKLNAYATSKIQVNSAFVFDANRITSQSLNVCFVAGSEGNLATLDLFKTQKKNLNKLFITANEYYKSLLNNYLVIETPDSVFNEAYRWALLRTDQFLQETPDVGTSLMAGFGTTARGWNGNQKVNGRPGYAWYFGRDGQWSGMAIDAFGNFGMVKKVLTVYDRYMDVSGKIYHELTSSGAVHYDAADASPLYLVLAAHYLKASGDIAFIKNIWPGLQKTYSYLLSTDTDGDGLIENTNVGHGWVEGGNLYGTHTEFYLAGCQAAAAEAVKYMAEAMNNKDLALQAQKMAENTKKIIDTDFWSASKNFFSNGKVKDGSYMDDKTALASVGVYLNAITDTRKAFTVASEYSGNDYTTDWGVRIISEFNPNYNPGAYHAGMVWPLFTGWVSLSEYATGCYTSGFLHLMQNMNNFRDGALGSIEETMNGQTYKPAGVCSLQCWSETLILQSAIEGMLGLKTDALNAKLKLSPRFPWNWNTVKISNIRMGKTLVNLNVDKSNRETTYSLTNNGKQVNISFSPVFPLFTDIMSVELNGKTIPVETKNQSESIELRLPEFELKAGENKVVIKHHGGKAILPPVYRPKMGQENSGLKVLSQKADGEKIRAMVSGKPGITYSLQVFSVEPIKNIIGGKLMNRKDSITTIEITMPQSSNKYIDLELIIE